MRGEISNPWVAMSLAGVRFSAHSRAPKRSWRVPSAATMPGTPMERPERRASGTGAFWSSAEM